jgi:hypothetical protein
MRARPIRVVTVEPWEIHAAISGWGIIRCPKCKQILRPLEQQPLCVGSMNHDLRE